MSKFNKALETYSKILAKKLELIENHKLAITKLSEDQKKVESFLVGNPEISEVPEIIRENEPFLAWTLGEKNDAIAISIYRNLRDKVQELNRIAKDFESEHNEQKEKVGNWILARLNESKAQSINCGVYGKAYKKLKIQASAADWGGFLKWAAEHNAEDAIQKRIVGSFVTNYEEENGELPPFLNVHKEYEVVVTK